MLKAPSPLLGYNNNVRHKNRVFHIQTEDSGIKHPHIITHLFMDGGRILKSLKTSYAEHVGVEGMSDIVKQMMKEQHKAMFIALRDGQLDHLLEAALAPSKAPASRLSTPAPSPVSPISPLSPISPVPPRPAGGEGDGAKSDIAAPPPPTLASGTMPAQPHPSVPALTGVMSSGPPRPSGSNPALAAAAAALPPMRGRAPGTSEDGTRVPLATIPDEAPPATAREASPPPPRLGDLPPPPPNLQKPPAKPAETRYRGPTRDEAPPAAAADGQGGGTPPSPKPKSVRPPRTTPKSQPRIPIATPPVGASAAGRYAPARPAAIFGQARPQQGSSIFGEDLISDKSLDEVILSYLAEDLETEKK